MATIHCNRRAGAGSSIWCRATKFLTLTLLLCAATFICAGGCATGQNASISQQKTWLKKWAASNRSWRGVHFSAQTDGQATALAESLPKLAAIGINLIVVEVNYGFEFQAHPEVRAAGFISRGRAHELTASAHALGIRLIPQLNCLGHQSWSKVTGQLLTQHPEFDETPSQFPQNKDIYCRSWCPQNPEVNKVVFSLIDDLIDGFNADAIHVGMDEVFLIASQYCPRCQGGNPAQLFAKAVNDLHQHIVTERKCEMLMWSDRLLDAEKLHYSEWEASKNATWAAVDLVPKDIIMCDWHYEKQAEYPSVPFLLGKGFRVWPSGWQPLEATKAFSSYAAKQTNPKLLGFLCTTWGKVKIRDASDWPPIKEVLRDWK